VQTLAIVPDFEMIEDRLPGFSAGGVSQADLAREFGISYQRIHQIVRGRRR
jgi:plasmid maintenance system antidote protein VapI